MAGDQVLKSNDPTEDGSGDDHVPGDERLELQRRTLRTTRLAVVPGQAAVASIVSVYVLLAKDLLGSDRYAGLAATAVTLGAAIASVPVAVFMRRRGRRPGLVVALLVASGGVAIAAAGGQQRIVWLYLIGLVLFGAGQAANYQARYVAVDLAAPAERATAIGAVVWIGTLGAVFGPVFVPRMRSIGVTLGWNSYIGPFAFASLLMLVSAGLYGAFLRPDPLRVAGGVDPLAERRRPLRQLRESASVIAARPRATLAIAAMAISQAVMVGVMTMTPPHMRDHNHDSLSALVIAVHIVGMYGLAPLVGRLVDRIGAVRAIEVGAVVMGTGCVASVAFGYVTWLIFVGLFLLGLGWSVSLIGGTALLSSSVPERSLVEAQGSGDLVLSLFSAAAAFGSGLIKTSVGYAALANSATALAGVLLVWAVVIGARRVRDQASV